MAKRKISTHELDEGGFWQGLETEYRFQLRRQRALLRHCSENNEGQMIEESIRILERAYKLRDYDKIYCAIAYARHRFG